MNILIIGATSAIAQATAQQYATPSNQLFLVARDASKLKIVSDDLQARGAQTVYCQTQDLCDITLHEQLIEQATQQLGSLDVTLIAHGSLPDQQACELDYQKTFQELQTNGLSVISLLTLLANQLQKQGYGSVATITSVAGDRGRQSNYIYGTAKGAVSLFLQGLRNRFGKKNIYFIDIKPGFVDTPMTQSIKKGPLWAQPESIAKGIINAIDKKKRVAYLPGVWVIIMLIIRSIPEPIFNKLKL